MPDYLFHLARLSDNFFCLARLCQIICSDGKIARLFVPMARLYRIICSRGRIARLLVLWARLPDYLFRLARLPDYLFSWPDCQMIFCRVFRPFFLSRLRFGNCRVAFGLVLSLTVLVKYRIVSFGEVLCCQFWLNTVFSVIVKYRFFFVSYR